MTGRIQILVLFLAVVGTTAHAERFGAGAPEHYEGRIVAVNCGFGFAIVDFGADKGLRSGDFLLVEDLVGILHQLPVQLVEAETAVIEIPTNHRFPLGTPLKIGMATRPVVHP